ncbi:MAG: DUF5011 domain-containing protein, partial [Clostridiales Family XIII bacterium]|nr:DUF5011 domain-containing protein [Clostridiales Family XIII bacterium]
TGDQPGDDGQGGTGDQPSDDGQGGTGDQPSDDEQDTPGDLEDTGEPEGEDDEMIVTEDGPFTVVFYDYNMDIIGEIQQVEKGSSAIVPTEDEIPEPLYGVFAGWDTDEWKDVQRDLEVNAVYNPLRMARAATVIVTNWAEFAKAYNDNSVKTIHLANSIDRNAYKEKKHNLKARTSALTIEGGAKTKWPIRFVGSNTLLLASSMAGTLTINNVNVKGSGAGYAFISGGGACRINLRNVSQSDSPFMMTDTPKAQVWLYETIVWEVGGNEYAIKAMNTVFEANSNSTIGAEHDVISLNPSKLGKEAGPSFELKPGSVVNLHSSGGDSASAVVIYSKNPSSSSVNADKSKPYIRVQNATLNAYTKADDTGQDAGTFVVQGKNATILMDSGSKVKLVAERQAACLIQASGSNFTIDGNNTKVVIEQTVGSKAFSGVSAAMRFRYVDGQQLTVQNNATLRVTKVRGEAAAIRFGEGNGNGFVAQSGGKLFVEHRGGSGKGHDPVKGDLLNAAYSAVQFANDNFYFIVNEGGAIELIARDGPAIEANANDMGYIELNKGAAFVARGRTASEGRGIFSMNANARFKIDSPLYFDFANTRSGGGLVFEVNGKNGTEFSSNNSDIAVWKKGRNINTADPDMKWDEKEFSFSLAGNNYSTLTSTSDPDYFNLKNFGLMTQYTRICGNNYPPQVKRFIQPTNADKYIYGEVRLLEGYDSGADYEFVEVERPAWTDEVYVRVKETKTTGETREYIGATKYGKPIVDDDGAVTLKGVFEISLGRFAEVGDQYEVLDAWTGSPDPAKARRHGMIQTGTATVEDKSPPLPAVGEGLIYDDVERIHGTWNADGPHNADKPAKLWVEKNGAALKEDGQVKYGVIYGESGGTWEYTFPAGVSFADNETIRVVLEDAVGNRNPNQIRVFRDAFFEKALEITVKKANYRISAKDKIIGYDKAENIKDNNDLISLVEGNAIKLDANPPVPVGVEVKSTNFKAVEGIYDVVLRVIEAPAYTAAAKVRVLPRDVVYTDGKSYVVGADHITLRVASATAIAKYSDDLRAAEMLKLSRAVVWDKATFEEGPAGYLSDTLELDGGIVKAGVYKATFFAPEEPDAKVTVDIYVVSGKEPELTVESPVIIEIGNEAASGYVDAFGNFDYLKGVTVSDEDGPELTLDDVKYSGFLDIKKADVYPIDYQVMDRDSNIAKALRVVVADDGSFVPGDDGYIVRAKGFAINKADVVTAPQGAQDSQVKEKSGARAWDASASVVETIVIYNDVERYTDAVGAYPIDIAPQGSPDLKRGIVAVVTDKDIIYQGDRYSIAADNIKLNTVTAAKILAKGTEADVAEELIRLSGAVAWDRIDNMKDVPVAYGGGASQQLKAEPGTYIAEFYVQADKDVRASVTITVDDGNPPVLTVPAIVEIDKGDAYDLMTGVSAHDKEQGDLTDSINVTPETIDTSVPGVYGLLYSVEDEDFNRAEKFSVLVVNDGTYIVDDEYILKAKSFVIKGDEVAPSPDRNPQILAKAQAKAWDSATLEEVEAVVADAGNYGPSAGEYEVKIAVSKKPQVSKRIIAVVTDKDNLYSGDEYAIAADNVRIGTAEAAVATDERLIEWTGAVAWQLIDFAKLGADAIGVEGGDAITIAEAVYPVDFYVKKDPATEVGANVNVSDLKAPTLIVDTPVRISVGAVYDPYAGVSAYDNEAQDYIDNADIAIDGDVDTATAGVYIVKYRVADCYGTEAQATRVVIVDDGTIIIHEDEECITSAKNFAIKADDVVTGDANAKEAQILEKSEARSWDLKTGLPLGVDVKSDGGYTDSPGKYNIIIASSKDEGAIHPITALVTEREILEVSDGYAVAADNAQINRAKARKILAGDKAEALIDLMNAEAWRISTMDPAGVVLESTEFTAAEEGKYNVAFQAVPATGDEGLNMPKAIAKLTVSDGTPPELTVPKVREVFQGNAFDYLVGVQVYDEEDYDLGKEDVTWSAIYYNGTQMAANENEPDAVSRAGVYVLKYSVTDSDFNTATAYMALLVNDGHYALGDKYIVHAENFAISSGAIAGDDAGKAAQILERTKAKAWIIQEGGTAPAAVEPTVWSMGGYSGEPAKYMLIIAAKPDAEAAVAADGLPKAMQVAYAIVIDKDNIAEKDEYVIAANNIKINLVSARHIIDDQDELMDIARVEAHALQKQNMHVAAVQVDSHTVKAEAGTYTAVFSVVSNPETRVAITVEVYDGGFPALHVSSPVEIDQHDPQSSPFVNEENEFDYMREVSANDRADGSGDDITNEVLWEGSVDPAVAGIKTVLYNVTNDEENTTYTPRVAVVNDGWYTVGSDYIVRARNYAISSDAVAAAMAAGKEKVEAQIKEYSYAQAWNALTGLATGLSIDPKGYSSRPAIYAVEIGAEGRDADSAAVTEIEAWVMDKDHVSGGDDGGESESTYIISANDITLRLSEASEITEGGLINRAKAEVAMRDDFEAEPDSGINVAHNVEGSIGVYYAEFSVAKEHLTKVRVMVNVVAGGVPTITVPGIKVVPEGADNDYKDGVVANDPEDGKFGPDDIKVNNPPDSAQPGVYEVEREVTDSDGNTAAGSGVVVIDDGMYVNDDNYILRAGGFIIEKDKVTGDDAQIIKQSQAEAWTVKPLRPAVAKVKDNGGYNASVGNYKVKIAVDASDTAIEREIRAVVKDAVGGSEKRIDGENGLGEGTTNGQPGDANGEGATNGQPGGANGEGEGLGGEGAANGEGSAESQERGYAIGANHISMRVSEARAITDGGLIRLADAEAWHTRGPALLTSTAVEVSSNGILAQAGEYAVTFMVKEDNSVKVTIKATVTAGEA